MFKSFIKNCLYCAAPLGLWFLAVYCFYERIPFPLELSVLPSLAVALGLICFLISSVVIGYTLISTIVLADPLEIEYRKIIYPKAGGLRSNIWMFLIKYFLVYLLPVLYIFCIALIAPKKPPIDGYVFILAIAILSAIYTSCVVEKGNKSRLLTSKYWKTFATIFYISIFSLLSFMTISAFLLSTIKVTTIFYIILVLLFYAFSLLIFIPPTENAKSNKTDTMSQNNFYYWGCSIDTQPQKSDTLSLPNSWLKKALRVPATYLYIAFLVIAILPSVAHKTAGAALSLLHAGGGIEVQYYYFEKTKNEIPEFIQGDCIKDFCLTKKLNLILNLGDSIYVALDSNQKTYSIPKKNLNFYNKNS